MEAYLQTSTSGPEIELPIQHPDPPDGTAILPLDNLELVILFLQKAQEMEELVWVRLYPDGETNG